ncbi:DivIVA domain-containing protein [Planosporangium thailandense]|uniref:Cell wall synthesis protein Wag31 n=1 Tax=Planosporangium thailandense TaxID=765197 RepID=A0ABX0Y142_9ACTN|nr:DivIVA domain-containing protein [Planosporangium thailandense]NJC72074.1 DivIVA domain-containing protein [Planosporangium thailandense]
MTGSTVNGNHQHTNAHEWVPLSAERIRHQTFRETPLGRRGYRPEEVHLFLNRVASEVDRWTAAYAEAQNEVHRLRNYFRNQGVDPEAGRAQELSNEAVTVLVRAQAHADRLIADAQAHASAMQHDARTQAEAIVARARQEVDRAAHTYRAVAGVEYNADREQAERLAALGRSILSAVSGATTQMDGATTQMRAIGEAFAAELEKLTVPFAHAGHAARHG